MRNGEKLSTGGDSLTQVTFNYLKEKLSTLTTQRTKLIDDLGGADFTSLLHDNVAVAQRVQKLDGDIQKIQMLLANVIVLPPREDVSTIGIGNRVTLKFIDEKETPQEEFWVGTPIDASYNAQALSVISTVSPLGKQIVGRTVGDIVTYGEAQVSKRKVEVINIQPELKLS